MATKSYPLQAGLARTKIVILAVLIFLGLLVIALAWLNARAAAATEKRVADVEQLQGMFKIFYDENGFYPYGNGKPEGIESYLDYWPTPATPAGLCSETSDVYYYSQKSLGSDYNLVFCLPQKISGLTAGVHTLNSRGTVQ